LFWEHFSILVLPVLHW